MSVHERQSEVREIMRIPAHEPIFVLRAQDDRSVQLLDKYIELQTREGNDPSFMDNLRHVRDEFESWQISNSDVVKRAD